MRNPLKFSSHQRGLTLIELVTVMSIAVILLTVAGPSFRDTITRNSIEAKISEFHAALSFARSEAISRGERVTICRSANQTACENGSSWSDGWMVFTDDDSGALNEGEVDGTDQILQVHGPLGADYEIFPVAALKWDPTDATKPPVDAAGDDNWIQFNSVGQIAKPNGPFGLIGSEMVSATFVVCKKGEPEKYAKGVTFRRTGRGSRTMDTDGNHVQEVPPETRADSPANFDFTDLDYASCNL